MPEESEAQPSEATPDKQSGDTSPGVPADPTPLLKQLRDNLTVENLAAQLSAAASLASRLKSQPQPDDGPVENQQPANAVESPVARAAALRIVSDTESGPHAYSSLQAACSNAKSGDTIELRFNGRRMEQPITISNLKLTIRAGAKFQPVVVFQPAPNDPIKYPPSMLSIAGGQLSVDNVHFELDLPRDAPTDWALFETRHVDLLRFEKCTFSIRGQTSYHAGAAFFDIKASPSASTMPLDADVAEDQIVTIELLHCIARGEASLVRDNDLQAFRLNWNNGLLAISERLLMASGSSSQPRQLGHVQISLRHLTAMLQNGLALLTNDEGAPYQLLTEINCDDSIFVSRANVPLFEQRGSNSLEQHLAGLQWSGSRDWFDGFDVFWRISNTTPQGSSKQFRFEDWQNFWRQQSRSQLAGKNAVAWARLPSEDHAFDTHTPADYALDAGVAGNPAVGNASDGLDAGYIASHLPALPPRESREIKSSPTTLRSPQ